MLRKNRSGQAAIESLMTYGWVMLAVAGTISALLYGMSMLPDFLASERCDFGPNFECTPHLNFLREDEPQLVLYSKSLLGSDIEIAHMNVTTSADEVIDCNDGYELGPQIIQYGSWTNLLENQINNFWDDTGQNFTSRTNRTIGIKCTGIENLYQGQAIKAEVAFQFRQIGAVSEGAHQVIAEIIVKKS